MELPKVKHRNRDTLLRAVAAVTGDVTATIAAKADAVEAKRLKRHEELVAEHKLHGQALRHGQSL